MSARGGPWGRLVIDLRIGLSQGPFRKCDAGARARAYSSNCITERATVMARTARVKLSGTGVADYHLMSRTNNKAFLFEKGGVRTRLVDAMKRAAEFCGIRLRAYTAMCNHFHVVVRVTRTDAPVPEAEVVRRVGVLKGERAARQLAEKLAGLRAAGLESTAEGELDRLRAQMNDVSAFVKVFKELFDRWYKREHPYTGSIWAGRFKSTLIEDGRYLATCVKYVLYNPIRAGMVRRVADYPWSWSENNAETEVFSGAVPEEWCLRRRAQIGAGRVYGSEAFVSKMAFALGWCFRAKSVTAHGIVGLPAEAGASVLGWKLAAGNAA